MKLIVAPSPHIHSSLHLKKMMYFVILSLLPSLVWGIFFFHIRALFLTITCAVSTVLTEALIKKIRRKPITINDGSALLTGILLAMVLPPYLPLWMAALGGFIAISLGKEAFGGLGYNIFNPALIGRAFLAASFPVYLTTWRIPVKHLWTSFDTITQATPLALTLQKFGGSGTYPLFKLLFGFHPGCMGEIFSIGLIVGGLFLIFLKIIDYRIPTSMILTVGILSFIFYIFGKSPSPFFHLLSGGFLLGAFFMATDPVTTPYTKKGRWVFGMFAGLLIVLIRLFGGYPEGVMYSILIMNAFTPLINRTTKPIVYGGKK